MQTREVEREMARRRRLLWQKIRPGKGTKAWTVTEILAYCQGEAWSRAVATSVEECPKARRHMHRIRAGLRAMIDELHACLEALVEPAGEEEEP